MVFLECVKSCDFLRQLIWLALISPILIDVLKEPYLVTSILFNFERDASILINSIYMYEAYNQIHQIRMEIIRKYY